MTQKQVDKINERLRALEATPKNPADAAVLPPTARPESWWKRNVHRVSIASLLVAVIVLLFGNGLIVKPISLWLDSYINWSLKPIPGGISKLREGVKANDTKWEMFFKMRKISELDPQEFQRALPEVDETLKQAEQASIPLPAADERLSNGIFYP